MQNGVKMGGTNPHFKSSYATLENVTDKIIRASIASPWRSIPMQSPGGVNEKRCDGSDHQSQPFMQSPEKLISSTIGVPLNKARPSRGWQRNNLCLPL